MSGDEHDAFGRPRQERGEPLWAGRTEEDDAPRREPAPAPVEQPAPGGWLPPTDARPDPGAYAPWPGEERGPAAHPAAPRGDDAEYVQRVGAAVVDFFVRAAIILAFGLLGAIAYAGGQDAGETGVVAGVITGAVLASLVYAPFMIATRNGQTLGHKATSTRIVSADGAPLSGGRAFVREGIVKNFLFEGAGGFLFFIPTILNYAWPLFDQRNEALHDKLCTTRVVAA